MFPILCCGPPLSVRSRTTKCKKPKAIPLQAPLSVCTYHIVMSGADIVKGSERVSSLGAHRFILFGVLHPTHQRFGVLFAFGVHFSRPARFLVRVDIPSVLSGAMMQTRPCRSSSRARWTAVLSRHTRRRSHGQRPIPAGRGRPSRHQNKARRKCPAGRHPHR